MVDSLCLINLHVSSSKLLNNVDKIFIWSLHQTLLITDWSYIIPNPCGAQIIIIEFFKRTLYTIVYDRSFYFKHCSIW
jgi:hypothetical protein